MAADVLLDRDGVLVVEHPDRYCLSADELEALPGAIAAAARLSRAGHRLFVITNQSPVGRGLLMPAELDRIHARLAGWVRDQGGEIAAFLVCPHRPEDGCDCRKPRPGLAHRAAREHGVDLARSVMVGDRISDMEMAEAAGCERAILVASGSQPPDPRFLRGHPVARDLAQAVEWILTPTA